MIIFGTRAFGYVDEVEGLGVVCTRFLHVMFVPLIPLGSYLMVDDDRGFAIDLSIKSVLVAWVRSFLFWSAFFSVITIPLSWGLSCCTAAPFGIAYLAIPALVRKASPERADELRRKLRG